MNVGTAGAVPGQKSVKIDLLRPTQVSDTVFIRSFASMRYLLILVSLLIYLGTVQGQTGNIGFGTLNPDSSAMLDITSQNKGLLIPRMTSQEREAIANPARGLMVFDSTTVSFWYYNGVVWQTLVPPPPPLPSNILFSQLDQTGIAGQAETIIASWLMPLNTLQSSGESIEIHAFGENIADTSVIRFKIGSHVLEFPLNTGGKWDARIRVYYKSANEVKTSGILLIGGHSMNNFFSGPIDFSQDISIQISAQQNQALLNGVGMEGLLISRQR